MTLAQMKEQQRLASLDELAIYKELVLKLQVENYKKDQMIEFLSKERDEFEKLSQTQAVQLEQLADKLTVSQTQAVQLGQLVEKLSGNAPLCETKVQQVQKIDERETINA